VSEKGNSRQCSRRKDVRLRSTRTRSEPREGQKKGSVWAIGKRGREYADRSLLEGLAVGKSGREKKQESGQRMSHEILVLTILSRSKKEEEEEDGMAKEWNMQKSECEKIQTAE
jgi:hypothetical protein